MTPIELVSDTPQWEIRKFRINFTWMINGVWNEDRYMAFRAVMGRRKDATWSRRPYPYEVHIGFSLIECSAPLADESQREQLQTIILAELKGLLKGANELCDKLLAQKKGEPPEGPARS